MARPQETYNKKELEKRRLQKRKEKEQRKEQRKAESKDGKSFEDMLAYVDENGNISDSPPDPLKKKKFNEKDVNLESKNKGGSSMSVNDPKTGKVTFFNQSKGFGFIKDDDSEESIFVYMKSVEGVIKENDKVSFDLGKGPKGWVALNVKIKK